MGDPAAVPSHLVGHAVPVDAHLPGTRRFELRSSAGGSQFSVSYAGELWAEYNLIVEADALPALVVAVAVDTGERVVVFDGGRHGRANRRAAADDARLDARDAATAYCSPTGADVFCVVVEVEHDADSAGPDDFVALSVGGVDEDGDRSWFVEEDLG